MRSNRNHRWMGVLCALVLTGQMMARTADARQDAAKPDDKPAMLAQSAKVGDTVRYKSNLVVSAGGGEVKLEATEKHTVKEIKDNKDMVLIVESEGGKIDFNGMEQEMPKGEPITVTLDKVNKMLSYKPKMEDTSFFALSTQQLLAMIDRVVFPDKEVKPGDSWTAELDNPAFKDKKDKKVKIKTTYVGMDKVGEVAAWKIKQTLEADAEGDSKLTAETTTFLDPANGQIIQAEQTVKGVPSPMGPLDWKGKVQRLKAEKKPAAL